MAKGINDFLNWLLCLASITFRRVPGGSLWKWNATEEISLCILYTDHIANEETRTVNTYHSEEEAKFKKYSNSRSTAREEMGRQRQKWTENIEEWTGKNFTETFAISRNRKDCSWHMQHSSMQSASCDPGRCSTPVHIV